MNEHWFQLAVGVVVMVFGWLGKRLTDHVDDLRKTSVTREELSNLVSDMRVERQSMHSENRETLNRIHERVDDLWGRFG